MLQIPQSVFTFNLFDSSFSTVNLGIQTTRLYLGLFVTSALILFTYSLVSVATIRITIHQPTLANFEEIYARYSVTLVCPCTRLSVTYGQIIIVEPNYHQLCSSDFVKNDRWLQYFNETSQAGNIQGFSYYAYDFRGIGGQSLFLLMQTLCETAKTTVINAGTVFDDTKLISAYPMTRGSFQRKIAALVQQFQEETQASFLILFSQVHNAIQNSQLYSTNAAASNLVTTLGTLSVRLRMRNFNPVESNC